MINSAFGTAVGASGTIDGYRGCVTGGLNLTLPGTISFPGVTLNGLNKTDTTTAGLTIDDETGGGLGWHLTATSTAFANGSHTLATNATTVTGVSAPAATGNCTTATNAIGYPVTVPAAATAPTAVSIFDASAASGAGPLTTTLSLSLAIPANAIKGSYGSTWTITLASGP
jgi:hypothetical protein